MSTVLANQINIFRPNSGRIFHRVRGKDCTRPCFIEWLKGMHSFCAKSKKTQFSNKAYLSNGTRFPVLKGRTIRKGIGMGMDKKNEREGTINTTEKKNRAKKKWRKKIQAEWIALSSFQTVQLWRAPIGGHFVPPFYFMVRCNPHSPWFLHN